MTIRPDQITRLFKFADEDRECALKAAEAGDWETFDNFIACAQAHERNGRTLQHGYVEQNRPAP